MRRHLLRQIEARKEGKRNVDKIAHKYLLCKVAEPGSVFQTRSQCGVIAKRLGCWEPAAKAAYVQEVLKATEVPKAKESEHGDTATVDGLCALQVSLRHGISRRCLGSGREQREGEWMRTKSREQHADGRRPVRRPEQSVPHLYFRGSWS